MPPKLARRDDYAFARCQCQHLVYASQKPGDPCLVNSITKVGCPCTDHRPQQAGGTR